MSRVDLIVLEHSHEITVLFVHEIFRVLDHSIAEIINRHTLIRVGEICQPKAVAGRRQSYFFVTRDVPEPETASIFLHYNSILRD